MLRYNSTQLWNGLINGELRALSRMITLVENERPELRAIADELLKKCTEKTTNSIRIGISGAPGVGKSTFIEQFGLHSVKSGHRLAVLAIDPTSPLSGGSILGDRIRMEELSRHPDAFIRPSPSGRQLGGVARYTRESILVCEAFGFDRVFVETVGVGQSEVEVASMVDLFLILQQPYSGDDIQGLKKGLLELADIVAVTKGDGDLLLPAKLTKQRLEQTLSLVKGMNPASSHNAHDSYVYIVSGKTGDGITELHSAIENHILRQKSTGAFQKRRLKQSISWFRAELTEQLHQIFLRQPKILKKIAQIEQEITKGTAIPSLAARELIQAELFPSH